MGVGLFIGLIFSIIILSGLISGTEAALLSISYAKTKEIEKNAKSKKKKKRASALILIKDNMQKYITTVVILNNLVNIIGSIYVGVLASQLFGEVYLGIISGLLTFLIIIFAEIVPKLYGELYSDKISLFVGVYLVFLGKIFTPVVWFFDNISNIFVRGHKTESVSEGEIREMAKIGHKEGAINKYENEVISNVFKMDDICAYDIMVPKSKVIIISENSSFEQIAKITQNTGFTRFPVENKNGDIIGLINVKDLFKFYENPKKFSIFKILRPIIYTSENMKISALEKKLKKARNHLAIVVNEHGDFVGIVTLEDIIEELLGEIEDEFDKREKSFVKKIAENKYHVDASQEISDFVKEFDLEDEINPENEEFSTLNGFLSEKLERIPRVNSRVKLEKIDLRVIRANRKQALEVEVIIK